METETGNRKKPMQTTEIDMYQCAREISNSTEQESSRNTISSSPPSAPAFHFVSIPISHIILGFLPYLAVSWYPAVVVVVVVE